ncbi:bifunctional Endonuclease-exonuclease-phosphatase superfamily/Inositol polyphosphate-related phosphatase [Babesia duncani]|uniref:Bifunctional Endonuclease-exonuclease-phosphatase superfamily/Inositol polyphosphate-related phosphatase n=1 Tax=Babesia duncani TaxID=323732 RepID=A0AAD9UQB6_9APIC|nr:bifunctional Endonuclease-exonuclease-phosphatase superfamily/Inositol polyphosphate-related phosphatase [Babesia duncani]
MEFESEEYCTKSVREMVRDYDERVRPSNPSAWALNPDSPRVGECIRIFVGSWNCIYQEFHECAILSSCASDSFDGTRRERFSNWIKKLATKFGSVPSDTQKHVLLRRSTINIDLPSDNDSEPLSEWISPDYDVYIISLQETLSSRLFNAITCYLQQACKRECIRIKLPEYKISGYGDGAILHTKSTSLAVWVRSDLIESKKVLVGKSKAMALSMLNHSKGAVALHLQIYDQNVCIIGSHLPSKPSERERSVDYLFKRIGHVYGEGQDLEFSNIFNHVIWTGDFNFRLSGINAQGALDLLELGKRNELLFYDEFHSEGQSIFRRYEFKESKIEFDPTYKKRDDRNVLNKSDPNWAKNEYQTQYETQWYKGKNLVERIPSWTDRVLVWSRPTDSNRLVCEPQSYKDAIPKTKSLLLASDHSPVSCGFTMLPLF